MYCMYICCAGQEAQPGLPHDEQFRKCKEKKHEPEDTIMTDKTSTHLVNCAHVCIIHHFLPRNLPPMSIQCSSKSAKSLYNTIRADLAGIEQNEWAARVHDLRPGIMEPGCMRKGLAEIVSGKKSGVERKKR